MLTFGVIACNRVSYGAPASVHRPAYAISRAPPAHHFVRRAPGVKLVLQPTAGRWGRRPLRAVCILRGAACNLGAPPAHHLVRANRRCPFAHAGRVWGRRCEKSTSSKTGGFLCENGAPAQMDLRLLSVLAGLVRHAAAGLAGALAGGLALAAAAVLGAGAEIAGLKSLYPFHLKNTPILELQ